MKLDNTVALVTGAGSGLGKATAYALAEGGARVAVLDKNPDAVKNLAAELKGFAVSCDVSDALSVSNAFFEIEQNLGIPRICVQCAGILSGGRVVGKKEPMPLEQFKQVIDVNLIGTFNVLRVCAYGMAQLALDKNEEESEEDRGVIINTASIAAYEGQIGQAAYSASKGGIISMTLPIARELARFRIRVMAIAPGLFETPMTNHLSVKVEKSLLDSLLYPNRFGKPEEFAKQVLNIIDNPMLNGEVIRLDGGVRMLP